MHERWGGRIGNDPSGNPMTWPSANGFTHINEDGALSDALRNVFVPARRADFLATFGSSWVTPP